MCACSCIVIIIITAVDVRVTVRTMRLIHEVFHTNYMNFNTAT